METFVELLCPECNKHWEATPAALPNTDESFDCPDCGERRPLSEFARTTRDLEVLRDAPS